jgi:hypothetical protein
MVDPSLPVWTPRQGAAKVADAPEDDAAHNEVLTALVRHIDAGKNIAYYENQDLGHPMIGHVMAFTWGSPEGQFEDEPPERLPDGLAREFTGGINYRYGLCAVTYALPDIVERDSVPTTEVWVALDIAAEGPDAMVVVEKILADEQVKTWRIVNPASDEEAQNFETIRERLKQTFEVDGASDELPMEEPSGQ